MPSSVRTTVGSTALQRMPDAHIRHSCHCNNQTLSVGTTRTNNSGRSGLNYHEQQNHTQTQSNPSIVTNKTSPHTCTHRAGPTPTQPFASTGLTRPSGVQPGVKKRTIIQLLCKHNSHTSELRQELAHIRQETFRSEDCN